MLFGAVHLAAIVGVLVIGLSWSGIALAAVLYGVRMFAISGGTHRYFAHRAFSTSRGFQFLLALVATTTSQLGVMWWASHHRLHHRHSDTGDDPHSRAVGFWWAHVGWFLTHTHDETQWNQLPDFASYRELRWLDRHHFVPVIGLIAVLGVVGGAPAIIWGYCVTTVLLWHAMFSLNSIAHWFGHRRYRTRDLSRNNALVALATFGEGWHNNHHYYPGSARNGFTWWEIDLTYYILRVLAAAGVIWDLRSVPERVMQRGARMAAA